MSETFYVINKLVISRVNHCQTAVWFYSLTKVVDDSSANLLNKYLKWLVNYVFKWNDSMSIYKIYNVKRMPTLIFRPQSILTTTNLSPEPSLLNLLSEFITEAKTTCGVIRFQTIIT